MSDAAIVKPGATDLAESVAGVSWAAIAAGAVVSCALTFVLLAFGIGLGLSAVSPWSGAGVTATTFKIGTGLYLIAIAMLSSSVGGYIADTDAARKATAQLAFWLTASLLLGAFCASLAATEGGGLRDGTWGSRARLSPAVRT
jgi:hypothetical protein